MTRGTPLGSDDTGPQARMMRMIEREGGWT
jgi:hypothetical protein